MKRLMILKPFYPLYSMQINRHPLKRLRHKRKQSSKMETKIAIDE